MGDRSRGESQSRVSMGRAGVAMNKEGGGGGEEEEAVVGRLVGVGD